MTTESTQSIFRPGRSWCPTQWMDEVLLALVSDPAKALLDRGPELGWCLIEDLYRRATPEARSQEQFNTIDLKPGQIVPWSWTETRGDFLLKIADDRTWSIDGPMPTDVTCWWVRGDSDTVSDCLETLVEVLDEPGEHEVQAYYWSDEVPLRFGSVDGQGAFVPCFVPVSGSA